jgi:hypothetical protein
MKLTVLKLGIPIILTLILFAFNRSASNQIKQISNSNKLLNDSINKLAMDDDYKHSLLNQNYISAGTNLTKTSFYELRPGGEKVKVSLMNFQDNKEKLVIRYSDIGCNTCVNLIFKRKERLDAIQKRYELIVVVDFDRYEDFVKWKRVSELENNIYWVKKGQLPFDSHFGPSSYSFVLDRNMTTHSFFVPNNVFPQRLDEYLKGILNR